MVHSSFKDVTPGAVELNVHGARNSCNDPNGYPVRCSGRYIASEDNEHYPAVWQVGPARALNRSRHENPWVRHPEPKRF